MSRKWTQYLVWKFFTTSQYVVDIFAEKCLKLKNAGILCRIFACLRLNLCARLRKKLAYGQMKNIISGADARPCASANSSMSFCAYVKYIPPRCPSVRKREWLRQVYRFPDSTECLWAVIDRGFWCACIRLSPIRLWRVCALPQTQPLYALSALTVVCVSLFHNAGARARVHIYCVCFQIYMRRPKAAGVLSGSFMRLSRAACAKCRG